MIGAEAYLILAAIFTALGFWRARPGWFILGMILAMLGIYASAFVLAGCAYDAGQWVCHYIQRPDILVGSLGMFLLNMAGFLIYGVNLLKVTLDELTRRVRRG